MSRVYSAMTGSTVARTAPVEEPREADEHFLVRAEENPFIEIGGPSGPVFSAAKPQAEAKEQVETLSARSFPRIAVPVVPAPGVAESSGPTYLSVRFHDVVPRSTGSADGPDSGLVALYFPDHAVSGEYRTLRDEIAKQVPQVTARALAFTAAAPDAGTTTVLLNLAITLARDGQRVLVADANFPRPAVAARLAIRNTPGLADVLGQHVPLTWALQQTTVPSLLALTAGTANNAISIARDLPKLIVQLRQWFDWVLVDAGVWGVVPDRDATCAAADAVYLVTREADAVRPEFTGLKTWVKQLGGTLRGYVTTRM